MLKINLNSRVALNNVMHIFFERSFTWPTGPTPWGPEVFLGITNRKKRWWCEAMPKMWRDGRKDIGCENGNERGSEGRGRLYRLLPNLKTKLMAMILYTISGFRIRIRTDPHVFALPGSGSGSAWRFLPGSGSGSAKKNADPKPCLFCTSYVQASYAIAFFLLIIINNQKLGQVPLLKCREGRASVGRPGPRKR